jgi:hypothetical protein
MPTQFLVARCTWEPIECFFYGPSDDDGWARALQWFVRMSATGRQGKPAQDSDACGEQIGDPYRLSGVERPIGCDPSQNGHRSIGRAGRPTQDIIARTDE